MTKWRGLGRGWTILALPMVAACAIGAPAAASPVIASSTSPAQYCATYDVPTLDAIKRGDKALVVVVKSFQPATPPSASLVVSLLTDGKAKRQEVARFAVHPLRAISAGEPGKQQRFLVSLAAQAALIDERGPLCLEIGFDANGAALRGGTAQFEIELADANGALAK